MAKLLEIYTIEELFERIKKDKKIEDLVTKDAYKRLCDYADLTLIKTYYEKLYERNVKFLAFSDDEFPEKLRQSSVVSPSGLYYRGDIALLAADINAVGIVGTRRCSHYGTETAQKFASELSDYGIVIVSGLATGVDAVAHKAALETSGGKTIAVLGMGHDKFYPSDNLKLYQKICTEGLVVSEYPPNFEASKYTFPERNRIISALSDAVIIIEAAAKSGALITADRALEQNKEIFAVPANITSPKSIGTNKLIQKGVAQLLSGTEDVLEFFAVKNSKNQTQPPILQLDIFEQTLYTILADGELSREEWFEKSKFTIAEFNSLVVSLEVKSAVIGMPGNKYRIAQ